MKNNCLIALIPTVNPLMHTCNTVPNPQGFGFLAVCSFHSIITHLWLVLKQVQFVASHCGGAQSGEDTQQITACEGNSLHQRSGMNKWTQGVFLQDTPMPRCAAGQLWPLLTAATAAAVVRTTLRPSPSSQGLGWAHKDPCLERGLGAEHQRTPLSSVSRAGDQVVTKSLCTTT